MITKRFVEIPTILENGQIELLTDIVIEEDGNEISRNHHRRVLDPDQDISLESDYIKKITIVIWTDDVKRKFIEKKEVNLPGVKNG